MYQIVRNMLIVATLVSSGLCAWGQTAQVVIGGAKVSADTHAIVLPDQPTASEQYAAEELQRYFRSMTGQNLPVIKDKEIQKQSLLILGHSQWAAKNQVDIKWDALGDEGIYLKTSGNHLVLAGGQRGCLYAVYTFLEDYLGVRWYTPSVTAYPTDGQVVVPDINLQYVPAFSMRQAGFSPALEAEHPEWLVRNKINGRMSSKPLNAEWGGSIEFGGVHSFNWLFMPPAVYFKDHPEYYALVGGKRVSDGQVCLSNPEVENIVVNKILELAQQRPNFRYVSVSQNDTHGNCECPECKATDALERSPSGTMLRFVNRVAERVHKQYPDVLISTLAYQYTRKPPLHVRPARNVVIVLCSIECSFAQPLFAPQNLQFSKDLDGWRKITDSLYIWDYNVNFSYFYQPHPNFHVLKQNLQYFARNNVKGVFVEGYHHVGGDLLELRQWLLAKLLWNPAQDSTALIGDFLKGYYGAAAPYIQRYMNLMQAEVQNNNTFMDCFSPAQKMRFPSAAAVLRADELMTQAEKAVGQHPEALEHVQFARLAVRYIQIMQATAAIQKNDANSSERSRVLAMLNEFEQGLKKQKANRVGDWERDGVPNQNLGVWMNYMRNAVGK